jgi:hypothetical protein
MCPFDALQSGSNDWIYRRHVGSGKKFQQGCSGFIVTN